MKDYVQPQDSENLGFTILQAVPNHNNPDIILGFMTISCTKSSEAMVS